MDSHIVQKHWQEAGGNDMVKKRANASTSTSQYAVINNNDSIY